MFRVSPVLRRLPSAVPPTAVGRHFRHSLPERRELASPQFLQSRHSALSTECRDYTGVLTERRPRSRSVPQTPPTPFQLFVTQMTQLLTERAWLLCTCSYVELANDSPPEVHFWSENATHDPRPASGADSISHPRCYHLYCHLSHVLPTACESKLKRLALPRVLVQSACQFALPPAACPSLSSTSPPR